MNPPRGGNPYGCLSSVDIEKMLDAPAPNMLSLNVDQHMQRPPADLFFRWRNNTISTQEVSNIIQATKGCFFVCHFRHHWVAARLETDTHNQTFLRIWDSAPSPIVRKDIILASRRLGISPPTFEPSPLQEHSSTECGLFALARVLLLRNRQVKCHVISCKSLRPFVATSDKDGFITEAARLFGITYDNQRPHRNSSRKWTCETCERTLVLPKKQALHAKMLRAHRCSKHHRHTTAKFAPSGGHQRNCAAKSQKKHGNHNCHDEAIEGSEYCKFHFLLQRPTSQRCGKLSAARKPCEHRRAEGFSGCAFHVDDNEFARWMNAQHEVTPPTSPVEAPIDTPLAEDMPPPTPPANEETSRDTIHEPNDRATLDKLEDILAAIDDPDFENELIQLIDASTKPQPQPHADCEKEWEPPTLSQAPKIPLTTTLGELLRIVQHSSTNHAHPLALAHISGTNAGYLRAWRNLRALDSAPLRSAPIVPALLELFNRRRRARQWKWTTMIRNLCEIQGACNALPLTHGIQQLRIGEDPQWTAALKHCAAMARSERPRVPQAATYNEITAAIRLEPKRPVQLLTAMTWLCTGRTGDCRELDHRDVATKARSGSDGGINGLTVTTTFRKGKTIKKRGPYSLHSVMTEEWRELLQIQPGDTQWIRQLRLASVNDVLICLRRINPQLENRSIRRGALQALATAGVDDATILLFSGHASLGMLKRYLNWGAIGNEKKMTTAAQALGPLPIAEEAPLIPTGSGSPESKTIYDVRDSHDIFRQEANARNFMSHDRWLNWLGAEAPPLDALPGISNKYNIDPSKLPLSSKAVNSSANIDELERMAEDLELRNFSRDAFRWLWDENMYVVEEQNDVSRSRRRRARCTLNQQDVEIQVDLHKYEQPQIWTERSRTQVKRWCRVFSVPEYAKLRRRHICEPLFNDLFRATPTIAFMSRNDRHTAIANFTGGFAISLDFISYYDQFPLQPQVRHYFGIALDENRFTRMKVLPMGFRPSAAVAQAATWCVVDCESETEKIGLKRTRDWTILTYIDNVLILARTPDIATAVAKIISHRATKAGLAFNEINQEQPDEVPPPTQTFDFLGEHFDLTTGSMTQATKTVEKLQAIAREKIASGCTITKRELAAVIGLCLFASACCATRKRVYQNYHALRFFRQQVSGKKVDWDQQCDRIPQAAAQALDNWLNDLEANEAVCISPTKTHEATDVLFVDASEQRWAAVLIHDGQLRIWAEEWTDIDRRNWDLSSSVSSEPLAIRKAICRLITPSPRTSIKVYTDHEPIIPATQSICAKGFSYWRLQKFVAEFPAPIEIEHIAGLNNPADFFTRGTLARPTAAWKNLLTSALRQHVESRSNGHGESCVESREWIQTARNPRRLLSPSSCQRVSSYLSSNLRIIPLFSQGNRALGISG